MFLKQSKKPGTNLPAFATSKEQTEYENYIRNKGENIPENQGISANYGALSGSKA
jgi:hypothetical protein